MNFYLLKYKKLIFSIYNMSWNEKYKPKNIKEIINNEDEIADIINWLKNFNKNKNEFLKEKEEKINKKTKKKNKIEENTSIDINSDLDDNFENDVNDENYDNYDLLYDDKNKEIKDKKYCNLLVIGNHGCGKTSIINAILDELKYNIEYINLREFDDINKKNIEDKINKLTSGVNIFDSFDIKNINKKKVVIIDDIETISTKIEKKFIEILIKNNFLNWYFPIIFISSLKHSKMMTNMKKYSFLVCIKQPTNQDLGIFMKRILKTENLKLSKNNFENTIKLLLNYSQNDYRRLLNILYDLYKSFENKPLCENDVIEYFNYSKKKDTNIEIYKYGMELMTNYQNISECSRLYNGEKVIIPLMIHQNYLNIIKKSKENNIYNIDLICEISESFSFGDIVENYIYSEQNWDMQNVHCHYSCVNPSFKLSNLKKNTDYMKLDFPSDLNRTSIKKINKKNVMKGNIYLTNMNINDFMYSNYLSKKLIEDKEIEKCTNLYKSYGANSEIIISILKIDKINIDKNQQKQSIKKILNKFI